MGQGRQADREAMFDLARPFGEEVLRLTEQAVAWMQRLVPDAHVRVRAGWKLIGFSAPRYFAFVAPMEMGVRLGFEWGVRLSDPARLLSGEGTQVRYVDISSVSQLEREELAHIVMEAAELSRRPYR